MMQEEKRKYEDVPTTELLNFVAKRLSYSDEKQWRKQHDFSKELEERDPFRHIKDKCDNMQRKINEFQEAVDKLLKHTHDANGRPVVHVQDDIQDGASFGRLF